MKHLIKVSLNDYCASIAKIIVILIVLNGMLLVFVFDILYLL